MSDPGIWAVLSTSSCLRARFHCAGRTMNVLQYCWVGSTCPRPPTNHDYTHMSHIKQALSRTLAFVPGCPSSLRPPALLCSDHTRPWAALLLSPRRWLRRDDPAPSPSWIHSYLCALSVPLRLPIGKSSPAWSPFSSRLPGSFYRCGESPCNSPWSSYCTAYAQTRTRLVWRHAHHAFTRRLLCEHPLLPSLPPCAPPSLSSSSCRPAWFTPNPQNIVGLEAVLHPWNSRWLHLK